MGGRVEMPEPVVYSALDAVPAPLPNGKLAVYARDRAGQDGSTSSGSRDGSSRCSRISG